MNDSERKYRKAMFFLLINHNRREEWKKISQRFETNDDPAGCKLTATGCMERFTHSTRDDERVDRNMGMARERGSNIEEYLEKQRIDMITPDMSQEEIMSILEPASHPSE